MGIAGIDWLLSFSDAARGVGWNARSNPSLEWNLRRTRVLLDLLGAPDRRLAIVLVGGTKGKGSTAALLASLLAACGVRAGLYTKPHLQSYRERIRVDGRMISAAALEKRVAALRPHLVALRRAVPDGGQPTTFELTTTLALAHFAAARCTVAVVEVGLGGRFDATNATDPHVSIITPISHDHTRELGTDLRQIAAEKAGILRPGRVAIVARQEPGVARVIRGAARTIAAVYREVAPLSAPAARRTGLALRGAHQRQNAALSIAAARALAEHGVPFRERAISRGLRQLHWPGRFEVVPGRPMIVLDGAHNDGSAAALARAISTELGRPVRLIIGLMRDKDAQAVARALAPIASAVYVTRPDSPRAADPPTVARLFRRAPVRVFDDIASAVEAARADARSGEPLCITGSLALVGQARTLLGLPAPERLWD
ncbi:MAG TPA: Mur ligase family protein [Candidatus Limnocylindria bacterium]|nr:Mur ligase family protein [Candidatus Limnocylindria bacterium]